MPDDDGPLAGGPPAEIASLASRDLSIDVIRSASDLADVRKRNADRLAFERLLCDLMTGREHWTLAGVCKPCQRAVAFEVDWMHSRGQTINFRERLDCPYCKLNNRMRFVAHLLEGTTPADHRRAPVYLFEQVTPFFDWATRALGVPVLGSEYLRPDLPGGTTVDGLRHEDALNLSFDDGSLEKIVSNDVFEHVPDIDRCLAECARVLGPGGRLYFSIPFHDAATSVQRAALRGGEIVELEPPLYHENPVDPKGSLVFYDHGWDILERCRDAGFADAYALGYWSLLYGYLGHGVQLLFVAEAPARA